MSIDLEKLRPILDDAVALGPAKTAEKHNVAKSCIAGVLSLARKVGAVSEATRGGSRARSYDPADVAAALRVKPIHEVAEQFGLSASTILRVVAEFEKEQKAAPAEQKAA